mgnify:CR=1 FL=1
MFDELDELEFETDDEIRKAIPKGTVAKVQIRQNRDPDTKEDLPLGDFKSGESQYGKWMVIPFVVTEGEYRGEWASIMLSIKTSDPKFRSVFQLVTGVDVSQGGKVSFADFKEKLITGIFEAELGPEEKKGEPTGYTRVNRLIERVGERDADSSPSDHSEAPAEVDEPDMPDDSEDVPF